jgi:Protein of unknown function (DUF3102)
MFINDPPSRNKDAKTAVGSVSIRLAEVAAFGEGLPETWFDYEKVPGASRAELQQITANVKNAIRQHFAVLLGIGESLLRAKEIAGHGNFLPWLEAEFRWSERSAQDYMAISKHLQGKSASFADLNRSTALALIKAPTEVRGEIMARADAGEVIPRAEIKAMLAARAKAALAARAGPQPKPAANVLRMDVETRRLVISSVGYVVCDPDSAPVEEPTRTVEAPADISRKHLQTILALLPFLSDQDFGTLYNTVVGERPANSIH